MTKVLTVKSEPNLFLKTNKLRKIVHMWSFKFKFRPNIQLKCFYGEKKSADEHVARLFLRDYMHIQMLMCFLTGWIVDSEVLYVPQHSFTPWSLFVASGDIETLMPSAGGFGVRHPITNCRNLYSYCQTKVHHHPTLNTITVKLGN